MPDLRRSARSRHGSADRLRRRPGPARRSSSRAAPPRRAGTRSDALIVHEVDVPALQVLEQVRDVHRRPVPEVAVAAVRVAERLQVGDAGRAQPGLLRRGEAEEELGLVRGSGRRRRHRRPWPSAWAGSARRRSRPRTPGGCWSDARSRASPRAASPRPRSSEIVRAEQGPRVVLLQDRLRGVARKADRVEERGHLPALRLRGAAVDRYVPRRRPGDVVPEVRKAPGRR